MIFEDLIEEGNEDLDRQIDAMKRGRREYSSGIRRWSPYQTGQTGQPVNNQFQKPKPYNNIRWLVPHEIIRANRPGYSDIHLGKEAVDEWLEQIKSSVGTLPGSIIVFLTNSEIKNFYNFDLLKYYEELGFQVRHMPKADPVYSHSKGNIFTLSELNQIVDWVKELEKPVLIHCSAGVDRTGEVSRYLNYFFGKDKDPEELKKPEPKEDTLNDLTPEEEEILNLLDEPKDYDSPIDKFKKKYGSWKKFKFGNF